jgi:hypothetical protein
LAERFAARRAAATQVILDDPANEGL